MEVEAAGLNQEYTFDVFLCVAILNKHRDNLLKADGAVELIGYINRWELLRNQRLRVLLAKVLTILCSTIMSIQHGLVTLCMSLLCVHTV